MIHNILFPTDFTDTAIQAGRYAEYLAMMTGARVVVVHTVEPVLLPGTEDDADLRAFSQELEHKAKRRVDQTVEVFRAAGVKTEGKVVVGHSFESLQSLVDAEGIDMIVMGTHALNADQAPSVGTLSHKLFFLSKLPVLFVR